MTEADPDRRRVKTVDTALDLLEALSGSGAPTLGELADRHSLAKSTVHRHLKTLLDRGDVVHEANRYRLSLRFLDMENSAQIREPAYVLAEPKVEELADRTDERAQFVVEEHGRAVYVHIESGEHAVKTNTHVGKHNPIHASAGGLAILAHADRERVEAIVDRRGLECLTDYTITDREALFEELEAIRDRGYSINDQGHIEGLRAIGAPVMSPDGNVIGALSISGPTNRLQGQRFEEGLPNLLLGSTNELELNVAY